jgi:hypothetical protein
MYFFDTGKKINPISIKMKFSQKKNGKKKIKSYEKK